MFHGLRLLHFRQLSVAAFSAADTTFALASDIVIFMRGSPRAGCDSRFSVEGIFHATSLARFMSLHFLHDAHADLPPLSSSPSPPGAAVFIRHAISPGLYRV